MTAGEPEEQPFTGVLEVTGDDDPSWPTTVRVFKDRDRYRVEALDGTVLTIRNPQHTFVFRRDDDHDADVPHRFENDDDSGVYRPGALSHLIERREPRDWRGDDFTTPTGPARQVTYLGRDAWEVELAPPEHKPSPLLITIDAVNGMTYEQRSLLLGGLSRWTQLDLVDAHDDELFEWHGDAVWYSGESREITEEEIENLRREEVEAMRALGVGRVVVSATVELYPHERDDDGAFFASFDASTHGFVARRPRSDTAWDLDVHHRHLERWSDDTWDWCVGSDEGPELLSEIRRQLVEPRPDER